MQRFAKVIKRGAWSCAVLVNALTANAQITMGGPTTNFCAWMNGACEIPSNDSAFSGEAALWYDLATYNPHSNTIVRCNLWLPLAFSPVSAGIYGPAAPVQTAPLLFDLGHPTVRTSILCVSVWPTGTTCSTSVFLFSSNVFFLTPQQMSDLHSGSLYVNVASPAYPQGEIRGQIVADYQGVLSRPTRHNTGCAFTVTAEGYRDYEVEFSTNLINWFSFTNVHTTNYRFDIFDPGASNSVRRYYRVRSP